MIIVSLSRTSRKGKGRLPPALFSFTRSLIDRFYLNSPINNNTAKTLDKPPVNLTSLQPKNGTPKHRWTGYFGSLKEKYEFHNLNSSVARMSTSSGMVKTTNNNGNLHNAHKELKVELSWIDHYLPNSARPYARLARLNNPIGIWLLVWPCMWSITLAAPPGNLPDFKMLLLFGCGSLLLRGAGCTWNDLIDANIDKKVERTKLRPIACGLVTPFQGLMFVGFQLLMGLEILLQLNNYSQVLGAASLPLVVPYPFMKRFTYWPQAWLAVIYNWGALLGWAAVNGSLDLAIVLPLYSSGVFWTLVYDTIYAHQDKEDDIKVGAKSTALRFGDQTKIWASGFGTACISSLLLSGYNAGIGWSFYVFLMAASGQLAWQIRTVVLSSPTDCSRKFMSNKWFGAIVFSGILVGKLTS